jgi:hypothetical protein
MGTRLHGLGENTMSTFIIDNVTQAQVDALRAKLATDHDTAVTTSGDTSQIIGHGVTANAIYDGSRLRVDVLKHPFYVPVGMIESQLRAALAS